MMARRKVLRVSTFSSEYRILISQLVERLSCCGLNSGIHAESLGPPCAAAATGSKRAAKVNDDRIREIGWRIKYPRSKKERLEYRAHSGIQGPENDFLWNSYQMPPRPGRRNTRRTNPPPPKYMRNGDLPFPLMEIRLGIVGLGTVGQGVVALLERHAAFYSRELGLDFRFAAAAARKPAALDVIRDPRCLKTAD